MICSIAMSWRCAEWFMNLPDPNAVDPITGEPTGGDLGDVPLDDDLESQGAVTDAQLSKDTKSAEI